MLHTIVLEAAEIRKENRAHAVANAAQAAQLLETDRKAVRMLEIDQALSRMEWDKAAIVRAIRVLREERALLEVSAHG